MKSTKQELFVTLPSNVKSKNRFEDNTMTNYKTHLKRRLEFKRNENWLVGLAEISYTKSWYNFRERRKVEFFGRDAKPIICPIDDTSVPKIKGKIIGPSTTKVIDHIGKIEVNLTEHASIYIEPGYFNNCGDFVDHINEKLDELIAYCTKIPKLIYNKFSHRVTLIPGWSGDDFYPDFGREIHNILGLIYEDNRSLRYLTTRNLESRATLVNNDSLDLERLIEEEMSKEADDAWIQLKCKSSRVSEMDAGCRSIYVYSDIVNHSFVGDSFVQLLRCVEVPDKKDFGEIVTRIYEEPHFHPLSTYSFDTIEIDIRDDTNKPIPFEFGRVTVKLLFRKDE